MKLLTKRRKNWLLILASIIGIYFIINPGYDNVKPESHNANADLLPQWTLTKATVKTFDKDGVLSSQIKAQSAEFFSSNGKLQITQPNISLFQADTALWQASATKGLANTDMTELQLTNNVVVSNLQKPQTISSQELTSNFNKNLLSSSKEVTITTPYAVATATGMIGNWQDQTLQLLNDVHVQITPPR